MRTLPNLRTEDVRRIRNFIGTLKTAGSWEELKRLFVPEVSKCLGGEYFAWNEMTPDFGAFTDFTIPPEYYVETYKYSEVILRHCPRHPIVHAHGWGGMNWRAERISDHLSDREYRESPLYREAYRHLDTEFQMANHLGRFGDTQLILTFSRTQCDYDDRERDVMSRIGWELSELCREVLERDLVRTPSVSPTLAVLLLALIDRTKAIRGRASIWTDFLGF